MRRLCVVTGSRAEYGLLYWLIKEIHEAEDLELQLVVTGMHLSPEFGLTWQQIEADGFKIDRKVDMLLSSDSSVGISKSVGVGMIGFADVWQELQPDLLVVLGDRFEIFAAATAAMIARIPIAHIHGGEATEGLIDESIRHSISKMAQLHFTATETYRQRVIQLGEQPERVFNVGAAGLDNIEKLTLLDQTRLEDALGFQFGARNLMVTFHPVSLEQASAEQQFGQLLSALDTLPDTKIIFTKPNADSDGRVIIDMIDDYVAQHPQRTIAFTSMGQLRYLSALQYVDGMVGNSSSGLIEAPSFKIGTIDIGDRQRGRIKADSVIDCEPDCAAIVSAIEQLYGEPFQTGLRELVNPYGQGGMAKKVLDVLRDFSLNNIIKKRFYDLGDKA